MTKSEKITRKQSQKIEAKNCVGFIEVSLFLSFFLFFFIFFFLALFHSLPLMNLTTVAAFGIPLASVLQFWSLALEEEYKKIGWKAGGGGGGVKR